jgi:hypothetical protein
MKRFYALLMCLVSLFRLEGQTVGQPSLLVQLAEKGDLAGIESLLASGANPNRVEDSTVRGWTALMAAAQNGNLGIARALICAHADPNLTNQYGATALDIATVSGSQKVASLIAIAGGNGRTKLQPPPSQLPVVRTGSEAIAFMKSVAQEPRIRSRLPGLECLCGSREIRQDYFQAPNTRIEVTGEVVDIRLVQGDKTIASATWRTEFPFAYPVVLTGYFLAAHVSTEDLLAKLLDSRVFTSDDFAELAQSPISEVRLAATVKLTDQLLLARLATQDLDSSVREAATVKLTDQLVLARLAAQDENRRVQEAALKNLTDDVVWARVLGCQRP